MKYPQCDCKEGTLLQFVRGEDGREIEIRYRLPEEADSHDCDYVLRRNAMIPQAEAWANEAIGKLGDHSEPHVAVEWIREFLSEMNRLARYHQIWKEPQIGVSLAQRWGIKEQPG